MTLYFPLMANVHKRCTHVYGYWPACTFMRVLQPSNTHAQKHMCFPTWTSSYRCAYPPASHLGSVAVQFLISPILSTALTAQLAIPLNFPITGINSLSLHKEGHIKAEFLIKVKGCSSCGPEENHRYNSP